MLLGYHQKNLFHAASAALTEPRKRLSTLAASLDALSPLKVLGRGYAMVGDGSGRIVRSIHEVSVGDRLAVTMGDGSALCRVEEIKEEQHG